MKPLFDHFGRLAPIYEIIIRSSDTEEIWSLANLSENAVVLDAGGGTGRISQAILCKVAQVVVADESHKMLMEAQKKKGLQPLCVLTEAMAFSSASFDCIIMIDALHHVADQQKTINELWRLVKPGGKIIIQEPDIHKLGVKLLALFEKLALMRTHIFSPQKIVNLFQDKSDRIKVKKGSTQAIIIVEK